MGLNQRGKELILSQTGLSEAELGRASLSAEQLINVLLYFNVQVSHFHEFPQDHVGEFVRTLAAYGASNLAEDPKVLPSERLARIDAAIREALVSGESARAVEALAPVIVRNIANLNLHKLYADFVNLKLGNRYNWLIDNVVAAIEATLKDPPPVVPLGGFVDKVDHRLGVGQGGALLPSLRNEQSCQVVVIRGQTFST